MNTAATYRKMICPFCSVKIEYDAQDDGKLTTCPHCRQDIELTISPDIAAGPVRVPPKIPPRTPGGYFKAKSRLIVCRDCGKEISPDAESCPQCGRSLKKRRGVLFYVFVGTICLIATVIILVVGLFVVGSLGLGVMEQLVRDRNQPAPTVAASKLPPLSPDEQSQAQELLSTFETRRDDIEGINWISAKPSRESWKTRCYLYIGQKHGSTPWLRLKIQYYADDWLFIRSYRLKIGDRLLTLNPKDEIKTDNSSGSIWETYDVSALKHREILNQILAAPALIVRCEGREGISDYTVPDSELEALRQTMLVYRHLGGEWQ